MERNASCVLPSRVRSSTLHLPGLKAIRPYTIGCGGFQGKKVSRWPAGLRGFQIRAPASGENNLTLLGYPRGFRFELVCVVGVSF